LSFASIAQKKEESGRLQCVRLDARAVLQIAKHCRETMPDLVSGQLLGLDVRDTLEVTYCFPFPISATEEDYQLEMMRCLREVGIDNNTVGWYQSAYLGAYQTVELVETFISYEESIKQCVCVIYDPFQEEQGVLPVKAIRLSESFKKVYKENDFTPSQLLESKVNWDQIFEEIPVQVHNSSLCSVAMECADSKGTSSTRQSDLQHLNLSTNPYLEKNLRFLVECMDELANEQQKVGYYQRSLARQEQSISSWKQKRKQENAIRRAAGEELLPEEDLTNPIFKPIPEPTRLDTMLIANQIRNYCDKVDTFKAKSLQKLFLAKAIHGSD